MKIRFKKLSDKAKLPMKAHEGDASYDLCSTKITTEVGEDAKLVIVYHTDLAVEIPKGYAGFLFSRSSIFKKSLTLTNCVGIIDSGYRGGIMAKFKCNTDVVPSVYKEGERFAQLVIMPYADAEWEESDELSEGDRNEAGHGSTGDAPLTDKQEDTQA